MIPYSFRLTGGSPGRHGCCRIYAPTGDVDHKRAESSVYRDHRTAVTIPTIDGEGRRLLGLEIKLPTVVQTETGDLLEVTHAVWSVATVWKD